MGFEVCRLISLQEVYLFDVSCSRAVDLGVDSWSAGPLGPLLGEVEAVPLHRLSGHPILALIKVKQQDICITIAHDHVRVLFYW
jgi:hypothetical protein